MTFRLRAGFQPGRNSGIPRVARSRQSEETRSEMKMLFLSSDSSRVEQVSRVLATSGIPCEIRRAPQAADSPFQREPQAELWIKDDGDCHKALMLCVKVGVGFSRPAPVAG